MILLTKLKPLFVKNKQPLIFRSISGNDSLRLDTKKQPSVSKNDIFDFQL